MEDVFNNRFGMMLQDLSKHDDGQPTGFTYEDSKLMLSSLAQFHAANRGKKFEHLDGWKRAGYWTGNKREAAKHTVDSAWERVMINFPDMHLKERFPCLGGLLKDKLMFMEQEFKSLSKEYQTLCHGDFKISNLFIRRPSTDKEGKVYVIDFQWFGLVTDSLNSVCAEDLSRVPQLLDHYYNELKNYGMDDYEYADFRQHADIVLV
eukprot:CAMPEP_0206188034 /NCGR_PEP_ID=MMETSP0166-20121206/3350_1 /ASSEMBLY_ACC=CAM_ASM_000260 /TAXON_ID=95228 /ORGANISM="Vannella robusta, Strain DIVA3 518/3/11/1/6" /LENGTH=205 /DNA_ID=CAMNT_0053603717 /DNA_START=1333 /DNA_END=1948 /DNA_ORIENTATION=-